MAIIEKNNIMQGKKARKYPSWIVKGISTETTGTSDLSLITDMWSPRESHLNLPKRDTCCDDALLLL